MSVVEPLLARFAEDIDRTSTGERLRSDADPADIAALILRALRVFWLAWVETSEPAFEELERLGRQLEMFTGRQVQRVIPITRLGLRSQDAMISEWVRINVALIKSIDARYFAEVEKLIRDGFREGTTTRDIAASIRRRFAVSRSRAQLIARDQIGSLNAKITQAKQRELGVVRYIWRTSQDERVRGDPEGLYPDAEPSHFDRDGEEFSWDEPPVDGHPGEPINCRCTAEPILPGVSFA